MFAGIPNIRMNRRICSACMLKIKRGNGSVFHFMTMERVYGPSQITRYNLFTSAMITGEQAPGVSSGEALEA